MAAQKRKIKHDRTTGRCTESELAIEHAGRVLGCRDSDGVELSVVRRCDLDLVGAAVVAESVR